MQENVVNKNVPLLLSVRLVNGAGELIQITVGLLSSESTTILFRAQFGQDVVLMRSLQGLFVLKSALGRVSAQVDRIVFLSILTIAARSTMKCEFAMLGSYVCDSISIE
jgi:hypothetical protein